MILIFTFLFAFGFAALGVVPPGMLNISIASIGIKSGINKALKFLYGAIIVVFLQSFIGFYFARYFDKNPEITSNLKMIGAIVFGLLTIFFIGKGIQDKINHQKIDFSKAEQSNFSSNFWKGIFLSSINLFPIPYYVFISLYLGTLLQDLAYDFISALVFSFGAMFGTALVYWFYALFFKKKKDRVRFFIENVNFIIGSITAIVALFTALK